MEPPKFLVAFNLPDLKLPTGRRDVTSVPGQALILLNDPLVSALSQHWASQLISQPHSSVEARIGEMFRQAFGRSPGDAELQRWRRAVEDFADAGEADILQDSAAWTRLAHTFFNAGEFLYYRKVAMKFCPSGPCTRRDVLRSASAGFGWLAAQSLMAGSASVGISPHVRGPAKNIIFWALRVLEWVNSRPSGHETPVNCVTKQLFL